MTKVKKTMGSEQSKQWILYWSIREGRFPGGSVIKNPPASVETWVRSLGWEDPWKRKWQSTQVFLPGKSHEERSLAGCSPGRWKESHTHFSDLTTTNQKRYPMDAGHCKFTWIFLLGREERSSSTGVQPHESKV